MGVPTDVDIKKLALKLVEKNIHSTKPVFKYKKKYEEYKGYYERAKKLVDPDTRSAAVFKEALKYGLKQLGKFLGSDLTKHPYYVLNEKGLEALFEAITAMDTINNARALQADAEASFARLVPKAEEFTRHAQAMYKYYIDGYTYQMRTAANLYSVGNFNWTQYVADMNRDKFRGATREEAAAEIEGAIETAETLLKHVRPYTDGVLKEAPEMFEDYLVLSTAGATIIAAEKTAEEKIGKLAKSDSNVSRTMGMGAQKQGYEEQGYAAVTNTGTKGKSLSERVNSLFVDVNAAVNNWIYLTESCLNLRILMIGVPGGGSLPWDIPLPKE